MTVAPAITDTVVQLTGAALGPFPTGWPYEQAADVTVSLDPGTGQLIPLGLNADYLLAATDAIDVGGQVTLSSSLLPSGGAWASGAMLILQRDSSNDQPSDYGADANDFDPAQAEAALDHVQRQVQEVRTSLRNVLAANPEQVIQPVSLAGQDGKLFGVSAGQPVLIAPPDGAGLADFDLSNAIFLQSGAGAVSRGVPGKLRERLSVDDFIGDGFTAGSPYQAAFTAGLAALTTTYGGGRLWLNPRAYTINAPIVATGPGLALEGDGPWASTLLSSAGNHDFIDFAASGQGASVRNVQLGCASGVTPTAGKLIELNQVSHSAIEKVIGNSYWNGIHEGGGNNSTMRDVAFQFAYGSNDGRFFSTICNTNSSSPVITVANAAGIQIGHYVYGLNAFYSGTPWVPLQPNTPMCSAIQVLAISGNSITLGTNVAVRNGVVTGAPINAVSTLMGTDVEFSINGSIYGYSFWWDDSSSQGTTSIAHWENLTVFAEATPVVTTIPGHVAHRFTAVSSPFTQLLSSTRCEIGILIEETGLLAPSSQITNSGQGILSNYCWLLDPTAEHNGNAIVIKSGLRIRIKGGSCDGMYGDCVIGGADANYNPSSLPSAQGDVTVLGYVASVSAGHGFNLFGGNWTLDDCVIAGNSNPPGLPYANNQKDGIHCNVGMASSTNSRLVVRGCSIGGASQASQRNLNPQLMPVQGHCSLPGNSTTVYMAPGFRTGPGALNQLTLTVLSGTGAGQTILVANSSFQLTSTTASTTATCAQGSYTQTLASVAGINLGDKIVSAVNYPGDSVVAIDPNANTITTNYLTQAAATSVTISFGTGYTVVTAASTIATPLDTTSLVQTQYLSQRSAIYLDGGTTTTYNAIITNNDLRGNITGTIIAPSGATITSGKVANNAGIDDVIPLVSVTSGALGLALNPVQKIASGSPTITSIVRDTNATFAPIIQIPGTRLTLLPSTSSATISSTAGGNIANGFYGAPGQPVDLLFDGAKYWIMGSQGTA